MASASPTRLLLCAAGLAALAFSAWPAAAQEESYRAPKPEAAAVPPKATSDLTAATQTAQTPAQQRDAKALATAVFAKPAAKAKAAQKLEDANHPELATVQPKPEWTGEKGGTLGVGGKGVQVKTPF